MNGGIGQFEQTARESTPDAQQAATGGSREESEELIGSLEHESDGFWKRHPVAAIVSLTLPLWLSGLILSVVYMFGGLPAVNRLAVATGASLAAGRLIILGGTAGSEIGLTPFQLVLLVLYLDTIWAVVLTLHAGVLFHIPWLGKRLSMAVRDGTQMVRHHRWMRRATSVAVLMFVMLPVSSTGSIGGSLLGRFLGLSALNTFVIVIAGSILGCAAMYGSAEVLRPYLEHQHPAVRWIGIAVLAILLAVLFRRYRRADSADSGD